MQSSVNTFESLLSGPVTLGEETFAELGELVNLVRYADGNPGLGQLTDLPPAGGTDGRYDTRGTFLLYIRTPTGFIATRCNHFISLLHSIFNYLGCRVQGSGFRVSGMAAERISAAAQFPPIDHTRTFSDGKHLYLL